MNIEEQMGKRNHATRPSLGLYWDRTVKESDSPALSLIEEMMIEDLNRRGRPRQIRHTGKLRP